MKPSVPDQWEKARVRHPWGTFPGEWVGAFLAKSPTGSRLMVVASDGRDWPPYFPPPAWEHVSVTVRSDDNKPAGRCPTWEEMCWVRDQCFGPDEWVVQFHPAAGENINNHPHCLHLWRPIGVDFPRPPGATVGVPGLTLEPR